MFWFFPFSVNTKSQKLRISFTPSLSLSLSLFPHHSPHHSFSFSSFDLKCYGNSFYGIDLHSYFASFYFASLVSIIKSMGQVSGAFVIILRSFFRMSDFGGIGVYNYRCGGFLEERGGRFQRELKGGIFFWVYRDMKFIVSELNIYTS